MQNTDNPMQEYTGTAYTTGRICDHKNGWYVRVRFWIFSKEVFVCSNCGDVIENKK